MEDENINRRQAERETVDADIEFFVEADIIGANPVDMSQTGVQLETQNPIRIYMRLKKHGKTSDHRASLVWAKRNEDGGMVYGLEFLDDDVPPLF